MNHASDCRAVLIVRKLEENGIPASVQRAFSPDLAPSDVFLFNALKSQLASRTFEPTDELVEGTREMTNAIARGKLETVFSNWKGDLSSASRSMARMSAKLQFRRINRVHLHLEVLMIQAYLPLCPRDPL
jgi:hypothetical protein